MNLAADLSKMMNNHNFLRGLMSRFTLSVVMMGPAIVLAGTSRAQDDGTKAAPAGKVAEDADKAILSLSKDKWQWMSERKLDALEALFHEKAVFVHMGGTMSRAQELEVIKSGGIHYKSAEIQEASVRVIGTTAIVLNKIRLVAVVGGNEVTNPFVVTEVYVQQGESWKLASLSFTRLLGT